MEASLLAVAPVGDPGGAEVALLRLLEGLDERGWRITLSTPGPGELRDAGGAAGWATVSLPLGGLRRRRGARAVGSWMLAPSRAAADRLAGLDAHVVYLPVDPDPPVVDPPWPAGDGPVVGYVGPIEPRRGARDLVEAVPAIHAGAAAARVVLLGDDDSGVEGRYRDAVVGAEGVEHYGGVDGAPGIMRHLDVLVLPAHQDSSGPILAQAMAVGTPVVATRVGGVPELVQDGVTGLLVPPGDPDALAAAVVRVLERRGDMGAAAAQRARRFSTPRYVDVVERLIST